MIGGLYVVPRDSAFRIARDSRPAAGADRSATRQGWWQGFWGTVTKITFADIAFSIDSILAAVGVAEDFPVRFGDIGQKYIFLTGGVLGIITMRFVVRYFVWLLDRFPGLAEGAYVLVAWIGLKLVIGGFHDGEQLPFHIPDWLFWSGMAVIAVVSLLVKPRKSGSESSGFRGTLDLLDHPSPGIPESFAHHPHSRQRSSVCVRFSVPLGLPVLGKRPCQSLVFSASGTGERDESKTRTFSKLSRFSWMNFTCRSLS